MIERAKYSRKQDPFGAISQMYAALGHSVSPARMEKIDHNIPKVSACVVKCTVMVDIGPRFLSCRETRTTWWVGVAFHEERTPNSLTHRYIMLSRSQEVLAKVDYPYSLTHFLTHHSTAPNTRYSKIQVTDLSASVHSSLTSW